MNLSKKIIASVSFIVIIIGGIVIYNIKKSNNQRLTRR